MIVLTLVYPYYNNPTCLERQLRLWTELPGDLSSRVEYLLVNDGSPQPATIERDCPINLTLVRIKWNKP